MKQLKVAIIGYGRSGRDIHTKLLKQLPELFTIVAYVEADAQRRQMIADEMGVPVYLDYTELFAIKDQFDLVVNASFSHDHARISKDLMQNGINVLSEKPAARDYDEFATVLEMQAKTGVRYNVFQQYRFSQAFQKVQDIIASGALGRIVQIGLQQSGFARRWDWQTVHALTAGSLLNTGPHPVDHALALMGFPAEIDVKCYMDCAHTFGNAEDYVKLLLSAKGCPVVDIEVSSCNAYVDRIYHIQGTNGTLMGNDKKLVWKYYKDPEAPEQELTIIPLRDEQGRPQYCREQLTIHEEEWVPEDINDGNFKGLAFYKALYATYTENADFLVKNEQIALQMKVMQEAHAQNASLFTK